MGKKKQIIKILEKHSNPWGYRLLGEDNWKQVAKEIKELWTKKK